MWYPAPLDGASPLFLFVLGYGLCLATPGPTFMMVASAALFRGWRSSVPVCSGVSLGSVVLAGLVYAFVDILPDAVLMDRIARGVSGILLLYLGWRALLRRRASVSAPANADFGIGFSTAFLNPITGSFFVSYFLAHRNDTSGQDAVAVVLLILAISAARNAIITVAFGLKPIDPAQTVAGRWLTSIAGGAFVAFGGLSLASLVR